MFNHANNFVITGGQFTNHNENPNKHDAVSTILCNYIAAGAIFDSSERYAAGRCHPRTRQQIIDRITSWIRDGDPPQSILWVNGSAGIGKSALMQSLCELLRDSYPGMNAGSFFFARGHVDRGKSTKLFVTLSYQLAVHFPSARAEINDALYRDPSLPTKSLEIQLQSLIINPLLRCSDFPAKPPILFIDGLDECDGQDDQRMESQFQIITLIAQSIVEHNIPIRFIIASRPEYWIRETFETLSNMTFSLSLGDNIEADRDIRAFLTENFEKIRVEKKRIMKSVASPWPPKDVIEKFVRDACGQFIYAHTILKFVGKHSPFIDPQEQLRIITTPGPDQALAFIDLDGLYQTILSVYPQREVMKRVLGGLLVDVNLTSIHVLLGVPRTEITLVLDALSSLIDVTPPPPLTKYDQLLVPIFGPSFIDDRISFCHLSFREFLSDKSRSRFYHIDVDSIRTEVFRGYLGIIQRNLDQNYETEPHIHLNISISEHRRIMYFQSSCAQDGFSYVLVKLFPMLEGIMESLERFRRFKPGTRMNHPVCFMRDMRNLYNLTKNIDPKCLSVTTKCNHNDMERDTPSVDYLIMMVKELQILASMARETGIRILNSCDGFTITRPLISISSLAKRQFITGVPVQKLFMIPGSSANDTLLTIQRHRHLIDLSDFNHFDYCGWTISILYLKGLEAFEDIKQNQYKSYPASALHSPFIDLDEGWLCRREWTTQRISLVCDCLVSIMNNSDNEWEHLLAGRHDDAKHSILGEFFYDGTLSDIEVHGEEYFRNEICLSFLCVMVNSNAWMSLSPLRVKRWNNLITVVIPVLSWFDRQLTNKDTLRLIENHDASLPQKMTTAVNSIFQHCFLPLFITPYYSDLVISAYGSGENEGKSVKLKVLDSHLVVEEIAFRPPDKHEYFATSICSFTLKPINDILNGIIPPSMIPILHWYPYFAAYLLNSMVKYLYCRAYPEFRGHYHGFKIMSYLFPQLVRCLPYAHATCQNLEALRIIKCLSREKESWKPVVGFCSATQTMLEKYDTSDLSAQELSDFELWLRDTEEYSGDLWGYYV